MLTRYLQNISKKLAYNKNWNDRVTRKKGTIFTVEILSSSEDKKIEDGASTQQLLKQILETLIEIKEVITK